MPKLNELFDFGEAQDFSPLPEAHYVVTVDSLKDPVPTKAGDKMRMEFTLKVAEGDHVDRLIFDSVITQGRGVGYCVALINACLGTSYSPDQLGEVELENGLQDLAGRKLMVQVYHEEWEGRIQMRVGQYMSVAA